VTNLPNSVKICVHKWNQWYKPTTGRYAFKQHVKKRSCKNCTLKQFKFRTKDKR